MWRPVENLEAVVNTSPRYGKNALPIVDDEQLSMLDYWQPHIVLHLAISSSSNYQGSESRLL